MLSRVGISLEEDLLKQFDGLIEKRGYDNRSEAIRDLIRAELVQQEWENEDDDQAKMGVLCLVFDHEAQELGKKLTHIQHAHHELVVSTTHVHMDAHNCLEVLLLKGKGGEIAAMADQLAASRGVKLSRLVRATTGEKL